MAPTKCTRTVGIRASEDNWDWLLTRRRRYHGLGGRRRGFWCSPTAHVDPEAGCEGFSGDHQGEGAGGPRHAETARSAAARSGLDERAECRLGVLRRRCRHLVTARRISLTVQQAKGYLCEVRMQVLAHQDLSNTAYCS